jgi:tetratricopeptide (TPR) repeat protein
MKSVLLVVSALFSLAATAASVHPSCITAYEDTRAGKLAEAAAKLAECGTSVEKPTLAHTVVLYDRVKVLDRLGRHDEALAQREALTDKAHFETGLADEFSGPGAWSRDPELVKQRKATGITRFDLLLDIAWRHHQEKRYAKAMDWAERAARHALTRYRPEASYYPLDREAGCAIGLRGMARFELDPQSGKQSWPDLSRGYIRGCTKLPLAGDIATLPEATRKRFDDLMTRFDAFQAEAVKINAAARQKENAPLPNSKDGAQGGMAWTALGRIVERQKAIEPVFKLRADYLAVETATLGREPLNDIEAKP